ncbi:hypothetical protein ACXPWS_28835 [Mycobacterium sp. BMJ-28]
MANLIRRFAVTALAAVVPLGGVSLVTAASSSADCDAGQTNFSGNCVSSTCKRSEVRDANSGDCRSALSAALGKAQAPAVSQVSQKQWSDAYNVLQQSGSVPSGVGAAKDVFSVVNSAIDIPTSIASAAGDTADALYYLSKLTGTSSGSSSSNAVSSTAKSLTSAVSGSVATVSGATHSVPKIGLPKLSLFGACLPVKFAFFRPCI